MMQLAPGTQVWLACRPTDMRKGFDGLAAQVKKCCGRSVLRTLVCVPGQAWRSHENPVLGWLGLCLFAKRLEKGRFVWPPIIDERLHLTPGQLKLLIEGMDWRRTVAIDVGNRPSAA